MQKRTIINKIKSIVREHGEFSCGDVEEDGVEVNSMGKFVALAEKFNEGGSEVFVYNADSSKVSEEDVYSVSYYDLNKFTLLQILDIAMMHEAEQLRTEKRCAD